MMDWYDGSGHMDSSTWMAMGLTMTVIGLTVIAGIALTIRWIDGRHAISAATDPLAILDERFARGEMDIDEYETRRSALRTGS